MGYTWLCDQLFCVPLWVPRADLRSSNSCLLHAYCVFTTGPARRQRHLWGN